MAGPDPSASSQRSLDWLNFFLANVQTAFGPFVAVWLASNGWSQGAIGTAISVNSGIALASQIPAGWLIDRLASKRLIVAVCLFCIAAGALLMAFFPDFPIVLAGEALHGITGGALSTAIAAIGLGMVGHRAYHTRVGRNSRYSSLGAAGTAAVMGVAGNFISPRVPFFIAAALCAPAAFCLWRIRGEEVDPHRARHGRMKEDAPERSWRELFTHRALLVFAATLFLFQFADASLLPLASEQLAGTQQARSELFTSALVVVPQIVTAAIATWVASKADAWGRKVLLIVALAAELIRAILFALAIDPWLLVGMQVLGGVTAVVIGILTPLVVADSTKGTGRYNVTLGAVGMISGIGATVSTAASGFVAGSLGFGWTFAMLAGVAGAALAVVVLFLPETAHEAREG